MPLIVAPAILWPDQTLPAGPIWTTERTVTDVCQKWTLLNP
ncbi:hypothetical protein ROO87_19380 [Acinetobacter baumannii]|nr:hypothetical protein [Acinetobacter baumannii]EKU37536.1 hypothetical protein ACINWC141_2442 [Acinetobacter sp. WC-141]ELW78983.1 hypothetical protein ACINWC743_3318 [Acinetobacter sp. WC-743]EPH36775.1 hypothetical protein L291_1225 [Acinetobacter guillouiae MSP4-18]EXA84448.1 hypothetical protein J508_3962 [Acinetobacter sp. 1289694]EXB66409.1 hypothetical protein J525_3432 [Acinetobacter sp. 21871]EXE24600.1 hypothetical protein J569_3590 [Acinetobacter sp. 907131]EXE74468.1 hypothetic